MFRYFVTFLFVSICYASQNEIVNTKVDRTINIASQLVKINYKIQFYNADTTPVSFYLIALEKEFRHKLAYFGSWHVQDDEKIPLKHEEIITAHKDKSFYKVHLTNPLAPSKSLNIEVEVVLTHYLIPHPSQITQSEKQMVLFHGNHYFLSPFKTLSQVTKVVLPSSSVESYSKNLKPVAHQENTITYGPYEEVPPFSVNKMMVHYENNSPFLTVSKLDRTIEVSHWGVISIEEVLDVVHTGAQLKGSFSRYDFQRDQSGVSSVKSFKTVLPASASDVYYRDEIGNISTSHLRELDDSVEVELRPRFPLFGGWKTHYVLGYYVPTYEYLYSQGDQYVLKIRFTDHIFDDSVIDEAVIKIILPEGSQDIQTKLPFPVTKRPIELHYTYLDTVGRPVIVLQKSNLVEQHIQEFEVHYKFQKLLMLQEPLLVVVSLYLLFILVIIYVRLDFSIQKDSSSESKVRISGYLELVRSHHDKRADIYARYDEAMSKLKQNKDLSTYQATIKKLNAEHKTETQTIASLLIELIKLTKLTSGGEITDKVTDLQQYDKSLKDLFQQQMVLVEKLVGNKMNKQQYLDSDAVITKKKEELSEKMVQLVCTL